MLEDLYQKEIIQLARQSRQRLTLDSPKYSARVDNPLCGDRVTVDLIIEVGIVKKIGIKVRGCALCEAASELLVLNSVGLTSADLLHAKSNLRDYLIGKENTHVCSGLVTSDSCGIPFFTINSHKGSFLSPLTVLI